METKHLAGSKWTKIPTSTTGAELSRAEPDSDPYYCHWRVIEVSKAKVVLQAILQPTMFTAVTRKELGNRHVWRPGWH
jgi:hypothetical protein